MVCSVCLRVAVQLVGPSAFFNNGATHHNSAFFGLRREIHSLHQALLLLGTQELLKIIIASGATRVFCRATPGYFTDRLGLWRHSVSCALMADLLARELTLAERATSFTAGQLN